MQDPNWAKILRYLYRGERPLQFLSEGGEIVSDQLEDFLEISHLDLRATQMKQSISFLESQNLIELEEIELEHGDCDGTEILLTPDGFEVAHERELQRGRRLTNRVIGVFTIVLATGTFLQAFLAYISHDATFAKTAALTLLGFLAVFGAMALLEINGANIMGSVYWRFRRIL